MNQYNRILTIAALFVTSATLSACWVDKADYVQLQGTVVGADGVSPVSELLISEVDLNIHLDNGIVIVQPVVGSIWTDANGIFEFITEDLDLSSRYATTYCEWVCLDYDYYSNVCYSRYYRCRDSTNTTRYNVQDIAAVTTEIVIPVPPSSYVFVSGQQISQSLATGANGNAIWYMEELYTTPFSSSEELDAPASRSRRVITDSAELTPAEVSRLAEINAILGSAN